MKGWVVATAAGLLPNPPKPGEAVVLPKAFVVALNALVLGGLKPDELVAPNPVLGAPPNGEPKDEAEFWNPPVAVLL